MLLWILVCSAIASTGSAVFAAGLLVERFADFDAEEFSALFDESLQEDFKSMMTQFAFGQLAGAPIEVLEARDIRFQCHCSKNKVSNMLRGLGVDALEEMKAGHGGAEVTCHYCREVYDLTADELAGLVERLEAAEPA